jgi:hypothetical protein|tara:strand:+ start:17 stop:301 length:285 start_codon:yes stop_codon:yes gene_type:complete
MANHTKNIVFTDLQQQILTTDLFNDTDNAGLDAWVQGVVDGEVNRSWKKFQDHWTNVLINDASFTDGIPSAQADFVTLILSRADYKNAKQKASS